MQQNHDQEDQNQPEEPEDDVYKRLNAFRPLECKLKKHPCKDCFNCLFCSDARCEICLKSKSCSNCTNEENNEDKKA